MTQVPKRGTVFGALVLSAQASFAQQPSGPPWPEAGVAAHAGADRAAGEVSTPSAQALVGSMDEAFERVTDYRCRVSVHVVNGEERTDIQGAFYFQRPRQVLLEMGAKGVVFKKDGTIRAWFLTRLLGHSHRPEDRILKDARGRRLDQYVMGDLVAEVKGLLEAGARATVGPQTHRGRDVLALEIAPENGKAAFSRRTYWVDPKATLPLGYETFEQSAKVEDVWCDGLAVNGGLDEKLFR